MNDVMTLDFGGATLKDVVEHPDNYPEELHAAYLDAVNMASKQLREAKTLIEGRLIAKMKEENATKLPFKGIDGQTLVATLKKGAMKCDEKNADIYIKDQGFDPLQLGTYEYKPSWTKAKEARKLGGELQLCIDDLFKEQKETLTITEA